MPLKRRNSCTILLVVSILFLYGTSEAVCKNTFFNPVTDINWQGILPIKIGGVTLKKAEDDNPDEKVSSPICVCGLKIGIRAGFAEPARLVETVKDPYCFPSIGTQLSNPSLGFLGGNSNERVGGETAAAGTFQQVHYYIFPAWAVMDLFLDIPCLEEKSFDIAYISEIDPTHNNGLLSFILNPEALLFGNPVAQLACIADSVAANSGYPLNPLFWCAGSWGSVYPLSGHASNESFIEGNALLASRMIFKLARTGLLRDTASSYCGAVMLPMWIKSHYRMHLVKPVKDSQVYPIGRSSLIWGRAKNPPFNARGNSSDNFLWLLFRRHTCCLYAY